MPTPELTIRPVINGRVVSRDHVLAWEAARMSKAARKIDLPLPAGDLVQQRSAFAQAKLALGADEIRRRLHRDTGLADRTARVTATLSGSRRSHSICELQVTGGNAGAFVDWFAATDRDDYTFSMVAANPDHFLIDTATDGRQEVIETTGGSPLATRFFVDYDDVASLVTPRDPGFPLELAGVARADNGSAIGGVRHEFRDSPVGFVARVHVEFPLITPPTMIAAHRWHLACEFSNWVEAAFA